jgi:hypothetical protein
MKHCPECNRNYKDPTLSFCLQDGAPLIFGKAIDEPPTAVLTVDLLNEPQTRQKIETSARTESLSLSKTGSEQNVRFGKKFWLILGSIALLCAIAFWGTYRYSNSSQNAAELKSTDTSRPAPKYYGQMTEAEQLEFIKERSKLVETLIGDAPVELDGSALAAIKVEINSYLQRKDSLSQKPFEEGLRVIYGRATQYAPLVVRSYETRNVPAALGLYQAMIESEYRDCYSTEVSHGLFGFSLKTAAKYGLNGKDLCDVEKQSDAAARYMSDLASDFGGEKTNPTLGLLAYADGENNVHEMLRRLRSEGVTEQSFWVILKHNADENGDLDDFGRQYVPRFFAAAIIGETPEAFELTTPPLTTLRKTDVH